MKMIEFKESPKKIRAKIIKEYIGDRKAVCFSCGNASRELIEAGVDTLCIGGYNGILQPVKWFTQLEIHDLFPDRFDATSGHLPMELMIRISQEFWKELHEDLSADCEYGVPTGSGETLVCLALAFPDIKFHAFYNVIGLEAETRYESNAPLAPLVELLASSITLGTNNITI